MNAAQLTAIRLLRQAIGLPAAATPAQEPAIPTPAAGGELVISAAQVVPPVTLGTLPPASKAAPAAGSRTIRFLPPSGRIEVNADWRNVAERIGSGVFTTPSGKKLFDAIAGLWYKGSTETWVSKAQWSGHGDGYARVLYQGQTIAILPWDREAIVAVPDGVVPFVQLDGVVNSGSWVWAGETVWYHFYRGTVQVNTGFVPVVALPAGGGQVTVRPIVGVRLGNVSWALARWQREAIKAIINAQQSNSYGQVMLKVLEWLSGLDPDRGLGKKTADALADLSWEKK